MLETFSFQQRFTRFLSFAYSHNFDIRKKSNRPSEAGLSATFRSQGTHRRSLIDEDGGLSLVSSEDEDMDTRPFTVDEFCEKVRASQRKKRLAAANRDTDVTMDETTSYKFWICFQWKIEKFKS